MITGDAVAEIMRDNKQYKMRHNKYENNTTLMTRNQF